MFTVFLSTAGMLFLPLLLLDLAVASIFMYKKLYAGTFWFLGLFFVASLLFTDLAMIAINHYYLILLFAPAYLLVGPLNMLFKFWRISDDNLQRYHELYSRWEQGGQIISWPSYFDRHQGSKYSGTLIEVKPKFRNHKEEIIAAGVAWPLDLFLYVFTELLHDFFLKIYYRLAGTFDRISNYVWRNAPPINSPVVEDDEFED